MKNLNHLINHTVSDFQDYFEYIIKKHEKVTDNPSLRIYLNKIENIITFRIKDKYYVELLTPETMKLLGSTKTKVTSAASRFILVPFERYGRPKSFCNLFSIYFT